jgi:hypothetical protein
MLQQMGLWAKPIRVEEQAESTLSLVWQKAERLAVRVLILSVIGFRYEHPRNF